MWIYFDISYNYNILSTKYAREKFNTNYLNTKDFYTHGSFLLACKITLMLVSWDRRNSKVLSNSLTLS